jgi:hypothetical protein
MRQYSKSGENFGNRRDKVSGFLKGENSISHYIGYLEK